MATIVEVHPKLVVTDGAGAIEYYRSCLGAREQTRFTMPDGKIVHAALTIGGATVSVKDEGDGDLAPTSTGGTPVIMELTVDDADAVAEAMVAAGGRIVFPIADQPYGQRSGRVADPYGHLWIISHPLEELTPAEIQRRLAG
ncbi:VOC family protein [Natronosporangium hydrolyticum]|uniref:VOC family protein n=1 Tax=Natronosporangium hydrolyticum TaxID=2811111 RepID=A0A895YM95_9ACTN|nr:VOC family protein [Natronosporangium hydrolyticum]QSB16599.1 VOC family protein [Natronosporangium hydrolyticum]